MEEFKGLKHFPRGDARLNIENGKLKVSNFSDSGFDGVIIDTEFNKNWDIYFEEISLRSTETISIRYSGRDSKQRVKTMGEVALFSNNSKLGIVINSWLLPSKLTVVGYDRSNKVFEKEYDVPRIPQVNWWPIALAAAALLSGHYKETETTDPEGNVTTTTEWGVDFGGSSSIDVGDDDSFNWDYIGFRFDRTYPSRFDKSILAPVTQVEIVGTELNHLLIENETFKN